MAGRVDELQGVCSSAALRGESAARQAAEARVAELEALGRGNGG